jgi:hypothetical protein
VGVDNAWEQRKLEARKKLENSYSPTHPLHALLDELPAIGITFLIIVLNHRAVISFCKKEAIHLKFGSRESGLKRAKTKRRQSLPTPNTGNVSTTRQKGA